MAVYEAQEQQQAQEPQLVDTVPSEAINNNDDDAKSEAEPVVDGPRKKTRRSRRGGYRRKRQQQKKVAALIAASAVAKAAALAGCDSASTATTEGETSSSESSTSGSGSPACARKKSSRPQQHQQQTVFYANNNPSYYPHGPAHLQQQQQVYPYPTYSYPQHGFAPAAGVMTHMPPQQQAPRSNNRSNTSTKRTMTKAQVEQYVALDCEMVGVGDYGAHSALARVTLIGWYGNIIMDELVKPQWEVTDYRTFVSGITKEMLDGAKMDFATCRKQVLKHLEGKILVGHALKNDLRVLGITHPWYMIRDTAKYEPYMKVRFQDGALWPRGLKDLCREKLNREIQVLGRPHCPKEDALAALDLYRLCWCSWEKSVDYKLNRTMAIQDYHQQPLVM